MNAQQRVLAKYPKAYCIYYGLSLRFVIVNGRSTHEISGHRSRTTDAWADAAERLVEERT